MYVKKQQIRHIRVLDLRAKIIVGWGMKALLYYCEDKLGVSRPTAVSYIDEAAKPYREKFQKEQDNETA